MPSPPRHPSPVRGHGLRARRGRLARTLLALGVILAVVGVVGYLGLGFASKNGAATVSRPVASPTATGASPGPAPKPSAPDPTKAAGEKDGDLDVGPIPVKLPRSGSGSTTVLDVPGPDSPRRGREVRYTVEMEGGLGLSADYAARKVAQVLQDPRGWETRDGAHFVNVPPGERARGADTDLRIIISSPAYVDRSCLPLDTAGRLSCHSRGKVLINAERWATGAATYGDDVSRYRIYVVGHEVGHAIGHSHASCPAPGALAPVMVQQTKTLQGCRPWPYPVRPTS